MARPEITVVVPVLNGERALPALLAALAAQVAVSAQVIIVDNGSRDRTAHVARAGGACVVAEPIRGRARARNAGVRAARAPLIAFTDVDCLPRPGWLAALRSGLAQTPLVAGHVELSTGVPANRWERLERLWRFRQEANAADGWAATANLGIRRDAFRAIGGFDESYRQIGEDVDLCLRARAAGFALGFRPDAVVSHAAEREVITIVRRAVVHGWSSQQHAHRWPGVVGWRHWRHPRPVLAGDWALRRFGPAALAEPDLLGPARLEYAGRVAGSALAVVRGVR